LDLVMERRRYFETPLQRLLGFTRTDTFRRRAGHLGGYDIAATGSVAFNL
jgi:hypothetical protein